MSVIRRIDPEFGRRSPPNLLERALIVPVVLLTKLIRAGHRALDLAEDGGWRTGAHVIASATGLAAIAGALGGLVGAIAGAAVGAVLGAVLSRRLRR